MTLRGASLLNAAFVDSSSGAPQLNDKLIVHMISIAEAATGPPLIAPEVPISKSDYPQAPYRNPVCSQALPHVKLDLQVRGSQ